MSPQIIKALTEANTEFYIDQKIYRNLKHNLNNLFSAKQTKTLKYSIFIMQVVH